MKFYLTLLLMLLSPLCPATEYAPATVTMQLRALTPDVYYVQGKARVATDNQGFVSNAGFVVTGDGVIVFDALGTPSLAHQLLGLIRSKTDQPIKRVYASHYHADHVYGLQVFKEAGAVIYAPKGANDYLDSETALERLDERRFSLDPWVNENTVLVPPDVVIDSSSSFNIGDKRITISFQGKAHSEGDLVMLVESDSVLFSGDLIFEGRIPFIGNGDTAHWLQTLENLETNGLHAMVPGHGPASFDPAATLKLTRRYLQFLRDTFVIGVEDLLSFEEIYAQTDWSQFEHLPTFADGNRINAYQVFLSLEQELLDQ
ncbi:MAG: MBL fold metallo-hydrolase [Gammaproteobacteria bacterium]|nr:MBL fold metallo-hydrolase [Gammaproteobacteria bacterium]MBT8437287.1 MBL fold metallo-hydrolase [Gammaproteobacteria bacterium]